MHKKSEGCFSNRYRLAGVLTARTPLHVGDGDSLPLRKRVTMAPLTPDAPDTQYNSFVTGTDATGLNKVIVIPGSTLKGVLRAWLRRRGAPTLLVEAVFGLEESGSNNTGHGGKVEFHEAPLQAQAPGDNTRRWWDARRGTCLAPGVALDPRTRTAQDRLLYYTEYAPEGSAFAVTVTAQNLSPDERNLLCAAFEQGFGDPDDPARVGAGTADRWGEMAWSGAECAIIETPDIKAWLDKGATQSYTEIFKVDTTPLTPLRLNPIGASLLLDVRLLFEGAVLVNDPSQAVKRNEEAGEEGTAHSMVRRKKGQYFLPGSSVRGALRAQARRAWQTLAHGPSGPKESYLQSLTNPEAKRGGDEKRLPALYRMLGAPGWRAPISVPDFELVGPAHPHKQEFVAVDRFTGGAAKGKKFSAEGLYAPEFRATIAIDLHRWEAATVGGWALLLLLFLLRDLREGDIQFGFGASKGYGVCTAQIGVTCSGAIPDVFGGPRLAELIRGVLGRDEDALCDALLEQWEQELTAVLAIQVAA